MYLMILLLTFVAIEVVVVKGQDNYHNQITNQMANGTIQQINSMVENRTVNIMAEDRKSLSTENKWSAEVFDSLEASKIFDKTGKEITFGSRIVTNTEPWKAIITETTTEFSTTTFESTQKKPKVKIKEVGVPYREEDNTVEGIVSEKNIPVGLSSAKENHLDKPIAEHEVSSINKPDLKSVEMDASLKELGTVKDINENFAQVQKLGLVHDLGPVKFENFNQEEAIELPLVKSVEPKPYQVQMNPYVMEKEHYKLEKTPYSADKNIYTVEKTPLLVEKKVIVPVKVYVKVPVPVPKPYPVYKYIKYPYDSSTNKIRPSFYKDPPVYKSNFTGDYSKTYNFLKVHSPHPYAFEHSLEIKGTYPNKGNQYIQGNEFNKPPDFSKGIDITKAIDLSKEFGFTKGADDIKRTDTSNGNAYKDNEPKFYENQIYTPLAEQIFSLTTEFPEEYFGGDNLHRKDFLYKRRFIDGRKIPYKKRTGMFNNSYLRRSIPRNIVPRSPIFREPVFKRPYYIKNRRPVGLREFGSKYKPFDSDFSKYNTVYDLNEFSDFDYLKAHRMHHLNLELYHPKLKNPEDMMRNIMQVKYETSIPYPGQNNNPYGFKDFNYQENVPSYHQAQEIQQSYYSGENDQDYNYLGSNYKKFPDQQDLSGQPVHGNQRPLRYEGVKKYPKEMTYKWQSSDPPIYQYNLIPSQEDGSQGVSYPEYPKTIKDYSQQDQQYKQWQWS